MGPPIYVSQNLRVEQKLRVKGKLREVIRSGRFPRESRSRLIGCLVLIAVGTPQPV